MKTTLTLTVLGEGIPGALLDAVKKAADDHCPSPWARTWTIDIDVVPESPEDEVRAASIRGG